MITRCALIFLAWAGSIDDRPSGNAVIRGGEGETEVVITTTDRLAGAIHSLTWGGTEFIDSFDHGRQLQSASNFDAGGPFVPEVFNPTEAGSRADGTGETSSSRLLRIEAEGSELVTTIQMAFWLAPGERSSGNLARNDRILSDHLLTKHVTIGHRGNPQILDYRVTFTVPGGEPHTYAQFEALTGYMPPEFSTFWRFDPDSGTLLPLDDGPGEQAHPVVLSTPNGSHAMGIFSPDPSPGYGRFRFEAEQVVKWNCVFRERETEGIKAGDSSYRMFVPVGTLEQVRLALVSLHQEFAPDSPRP